MSNFIDNFIIGSTDDAERLQSATMLLISDSHGNVPVLESILSEFAPSCDVLLFCGDGAADFWQIFTKNATYAENSGKTEKYKILLPPCVALARGNGDFMNYPMHHGWQQYRRFHFQVPERVFFRAAGKTVFAMHGHRHDVREGLDRLSAAASIMDADLVCYGHTHIPAATEIGGTLFLNPGSCAIPRGGSPASFAVVSFPGAAERFDVRFYEIRHNILGSPEFKIFHP